MTSSQAAATLARSGGERKFSLRQSERIKAYWASDKSKAHKRAMKDNPIRTRAKTITK